MEITILISKSQYGDMELLFLKEISLLIIKDEKGINLIGGNSASYMYDKLSDKSSETTGSIIKMKPFLVRIYEKMDGYTTSVIESMAELETWMESMKL